MADEHLAGSDRERVLNRLEAWLEAELRGKIAPLMVLSEAADLSGLARGLAYQLTETLGVLRRETASAEIKALDQAARAQLRKYGVRFGAFNVYVPALLKPAAADLLLMLWALHSGREHGIDVDALPARPQQGLTSVEAGSTPESYWRAAGFHVAGSRAVRIDMLERLSDLIRARVAYRAAEGGVARPRGATGDGGFRVAPELMSVVGCSGEEFCSILKALGFRRERRKLAPAPHSGASAPEPGQETATAEAQAEIFDEIWRPGRRKEAHHERHERRREPKKPRREEREMAPRRERQRPEAQAKHEAKSERERKAAVEHSPFAALEGLRRTLAARQAEKS
jgi:ATP-dependent RNA helicase SUPV3L1/SUV3